ncbi:MAG: histidine kinase dimerization/phospho-acceptor domain-containing protein [Myxococcaceae bacterium]
MPISNALFTESAPEEGRGGDGEGRRELVGLLSDSLLHDARNPLNALSINLEVLAERLRREKGGPLPPAQEKSLKSMREQVLRVDAILQRYVEFLSPRAEGPGEVDLSALAQRAIDILGHQARRDRVQVRSSLAPNLRARAADPATLRRQVLEPLAQALADAGPGGEVVVTAREERGRAVYRVKGPKGPRGDVEISLPLE